MGTRSKDWTAWDPRWTAPPEFGPYVPEALLGTGGMARVDVARREDDGRRFAMKRMLPELASREVFVRMFREEAELGLLLQHPNVVRCVDFGEQDGELVLVTEYVEGTSCGKLLRTARSRREGAPLGAALCVADQVLDALAYVHALTDAGGAPLHIVHGDVSPGNILTGASGEVKLADFGVAQHGAPGGGDASVLKGKPGYMSPEQASGGPIDRRSDLFSLGVVLCELVTGEAFVTAESQAEVVARMRDDPLAPLVRPRGRALPMELRLILATALARDPRDRFRDAEEFRRTLSAFTRHAGVPVQRRTLVDWMHALRVLPGAGRPALR